MTIKLSRKEIEIIMSDKSIRPIMAWVYEDRLACHKDEVLNLWVIDHVPTGYQVTTFDGHYRNIRPLLDKVDCLLDWTISDINLITQFLYGEKYFKHQKIRRIIEEFQGETQ